MADLGHLEKMGRELKCPICLGLLKSSVSLACNHVFCNLCIMESMKSVSDCPVCKVPFRRREVRPAPHMDNLVSIYKGMEVAAGVNIFTTQTGPTIKNSDAQLPNNGEGNCDAAKTSTKTCRKSKGSRLSKKKHKALNKADVGPNSSSSTMPSFPAKKRVHVTPYPPSETPIRPGKIINSANPSTQSEANQTINKNKDQANRKPGDPVFSPFFWLRERNDDDDNNSDKHSTQPTAEVSPFNVPCFSDIKDSDDEDQIKNTPMSKLDAAGHFDSEMFEWTQRACSPELCSTPLKDQICIGNLDGIEGKEHQEQLPVVGRDEILQSVGAKRKCLKKKSCNAKKQRKSANGTYDSISKEALQLLHLDSIDIAKDSSPDDGDLERNKPLNRGKKGCKRLNKESSNYQRKCVPKSMKHVTIAETSGQPLPSITEVKHPSIGNEKSELSHPLSILETRSDREAEKENDSSRGKQRTKIQSRRKNMKSAKLTVMDAPDLGPRKTATGVIFQDEHIQEANANLLILSKDHVENGETSRKRHPKRVTEIQKEGKTKKTRRDCNENVTDPKDADDNNCLTTTISGRECKSMSINSTIRSGVACFGTSDAIMKKCRNIPPKIQCAFCQSDNDTEVSGEMIHYFNGKPVTADYNGGLNIIHAHKNCTEWAPHVYFEDEVAINLVAEVGRSKRIKCCCCNIKGAALGCFARSCRKSFHFTCAKLIPECRWDNENYVVLCPLHSSSKLPIEISEPQRKCRKKTTPREPQALSIHNLCQSTGVKWKWPSGLPSKWVLCCSSLSSDEKATVSKFAKLVGVSVSKSWTPTITHVIASTDENGACRRTLKFLMAIIHGKWILNIKWIKDCMEAMEPVDEAKYEIKADVNGIRDGPRQGRLMAISKKPKLFNSLKFYLNGEFAASYKGYLQELISVAGGVVLQRKPISRDKERLLDGSHLQVTYIIYSTEISDMHQSNRESVIARRKDEAEVLADATGAKVASNKWIIDSIAACELQQLN